MPMAELGDHGTTVAMEGRATADPELNSTVALEIREQMKAVEANACGGGLRVEPKRCRLLSLELAAEDPLRGGQEGGNRPSFRHGAKQTCAILSPKEIVRMHSKLLAEV